MVLHRVRATGAVKSYRGNFDMLTGMDSVTVLICQVTLLKISFGMEKCVWEGDLLRLLRVQTSSPK